MLDTKGGKEGLIHTCTHNLDNQVHNNLKSYMYTKQMKKRDLYVIFRISAHTHSFFIAYEIYFERIHYLTS